MTDIAGTNVASAIVPFTTEDKFATHVSTYGQGGWHEVATIADRDAIPADRKLAGMAVFVTSEQKLYILNADLTTWTEFESGNGSDVVRKTSDLYTFEPEFEGEIVQYIGNTDTDHGFTHGYFYRCSTTTDQDGGVVDNEHSIYAEGQSLIVYNQSEFATSIRRMYYKPDYVVVEHNPNGSPIEVIIRGYYANGTPTGATIGTGINPSTGRCPAVGLQFIGVLSVDENTSIKIDIEEVQFYGWHQIDVQPATNMAWGNITGTITNQTDLVNYVNENGGKIDNIAIHGVNQTITNKTVDLSVVEQWEELPEATEDNEGQVVQYIGDTDTYTHGYFYECVSDGGDPATYSWEQINVQDNSGSIAEGVVNHNSAQLVVNPIYDWVGTLAQYTDQNIETLHPEWICFITDDGSVTGGGSSGGSFVPENVGVEGDVLTRTSTGYAWAEGSGGSGKTEDENGNLYITDKFAVNSDDEQYPLIFRTKSEDDSNTIKINAPVEIIDNDGSSRSLRVSGTLTAKDTSVKSLTIDGTVRANGNIWMGRGKQTRQKIQSSNGVVFHREYYTGASWAWVSEDGDWSWVYTEKEIPEVNDNLYNNSDLTDQYGTVISSWEDNQWAWDSSRASIKDVKEISFHGDANGFIDNVYKIRGQNWNIEGNGRAEFNSIHSTNDNWELGGDGTFRGKKIDLNSGNNRMGGLTVEGAIKVYGESTVTGTSHHFRDIKLYQKESGDGYARIYPEENETSSLGTPNHRFGKIYVKDIDISGSGGIDIAHLDGVEEINENTVQFEKMTESASGYYNAKGQYVGSTVRQYINSVEDLPLVVTSFVGANGNTYDFGATVNGITTWYDETNDVYIYTDTEEISEGTVAYSDVYCLSPYTTVASIVKDATYTAINSGWTYDGVFEEVAMIGVEGGDIQGIRITIPNSSILRATDVTYYYIGTGNGSYADYYLFQAKNARASDWSDGIARPYIWTYRNRGPAIGGTVYSVNDDGSNPNGGNAYYNLAVVVGLERQTVQCIKGLTSEGGSTPGDLQLAVMYTGGQITTIFHGQYWDGANLQNTYAWLDSPQYPRVGDPIYKALYDFNSNATTKLTDVIGTVTEVIIPENSVVVAAETGDIHNYAKKHFNYFQAKLEMQQNADSIAKFVYGGFYNNQLNQYGMRIYIDIDSNPAGGIVDFANSTFAAGQSLKVYDQQQFMYIIKRYAPSCEYITIVQSPNSQSNRIYTKYYDSNNVVIFDVDSGLDSEGKNSFIGVQFTGVPTVDANTFVKIYYNPVGDTVKYENTNTELLEKSDLTWAYYTGSEVTYPGGGTSYTHYLWGLAGGRYTSVTSTDVGSRWINSEGTRNPRVGDTLYLYHGSYPWNTWDKGCRPIVRQITTEKYYRWKQDLGSGNINTYNTYARNPKVNSEAWASSSWGGLFYPTESVSSVVPESVLGIYYLNPTSQYLYYDGTTFEECFYHAETSDNIYSDIKLNNFYYWRALDGSYAVAEGKEHETVETHEDLPYPNLILLSVEDQSEWFFDRDYSSDTSTARAWKPNFSNIPVYYTDASIFVNHVGDKIYSDSSLTTEIGTIANVAYLDETVKVGNTEFTLSIGLDHSTYFIWQDENGNELYSKMPNPEIGDVFYSDNTLETEYGSVTEIVSGEPKAGTFYELEGYDHQTSTGHYFWNGSEFVEAEKLYKSVTLYGDDNDLGKLRTPWKNVYAESVESPYGTVTTKNGYMEVNGQKITNVTEINYNGADYIYTTSRAVSLPESVNNGQYTELKPVELTLTYCKWQPDADVDPDAAYYTRDINVSAGDTMYSDPDCTVADTSIDSISTTLKTVYTWTNASSGNTVYSTIRQLLEDDEIYDNQYCIRDVNLMQVISAQYTDVYKESIIMNSDSITLVIRDINGDVTGSCMLNAAKLNKLEQLLSD